MKGSDLEILCTRNGHEKCLRKLALQLCEKPEDVATMTLMEVCDFICDEGYELLSYPNHEVFFLVRAEDREAVLRNLVSVHR